MVYIVYQFTWILDCKNGRITDRNFSMCGPLNIDRKEFFTECLVASFPALTRWKMDSFSVEMTTIRGGRRRRSLLTLGRHIFLGCPPETNAPLEEIVLFCFVFSQRKKKREFHSTILPQHSIQQLVTCQLLLMTREKNYSPRSSVLLFETKRLTIYTFSKWEKEKKKTNVLSHFYVADVCCVSK